MTAESIVKIIQLILAPAVMVTTCAILLGGMQGHYAAVNDRLRAMARERLDLLLGLGQSSNPEAFVSERLEQIDRPRASPAGAGRDTIRRPPGSGWGSSGRCCA